VFRALLTRARLPPGAVLISRVNTNTVTMNAAGRFLPGVLARRRPCAQNPFDAARDHGLHHRKLGDSLGEGRSGGCGGWSGEILKMVLLLVGRPRIFGCSLGRESDRMSLCSSGNFEGMNCSVGFSLPCGASRSAFDTINDGLAQQSCGACVLAEMSSNPRARKEGQRDGPQVVEPERCRASR